MFTDDTVLLFATDSASVATMIQLTEILEYKESSKGLSIVHVPTINIMGKTKKKKKKTDIIPAQREEAVHMLKESLAAVSLFCACACACVCFDLLFFDCLNNLSSFLFSVCIFGC